MSDKKEKDAKSSDKIRCKKCNSTFGYLRMKDKSWICRACGFVSKEVVV
jgi:ribosomal protein L37AE/L43A